MILANELFQENGTISNLDKEIEHRRSNAK